MRVTIRSVAKLAGVAPSTVSHYLNRTAPVSQATTENVERAIHRLNYRVNHGARSLRLQKTHSIGLVIPNISSPFFFEIATTIEDKLWEQGYQTLLCISERNIEREYSQCANLASRQVDGILLAYNSEQSRLADISQDLNVPVVFFDRPVSGRNSVATDNRLGGRLAARHLAELGHRTIGILCGEGEIENVKERIIGFKSELKKWDIEIRDDYVIHGLQAIQLGLEVTELIDKTPRPTAIFATNDIVAMGAWYVLLSAGLRIPDDISIVGYDDIEVTRYLIPPLTTVAQPTGEIGNESVKMLLDLIRGGPSSDVLPPKELAIPPTLIVRGSSGIVKNQG
jgi:LacI family transcriptional regulator, galactose operon repressor